MKFYWSLKQVPEMSWRLMRTSTLLWLIVPLLVGCDTLLGTPPGKGRKAQAGYRAAAPVILALENFREAHGHYPADLFELVPVYLPERRALLVRGRVEPLHSPHADMHTGEKKCSRFDEFRYYRDQDTFTLVFSYTGPGMNHCAYYSKTRTWHSRGYY